MTAPSERPFGQPALAVPVEPAGGLAAARFDQAQWTGSKRQREELRAKFDGKCAYCGNALGRSMHADHLEPCIRITTDPSNPFPSAERRMLKPERNIVANMMPACAPCNLHKGGYTLEGWRDIIQRSAAIVRKQTSTFKAGERFGIIAVSDAPVRFYFERLAECAECADGMYPMYGVAPHECYWRKGPEFTLGQSTLLPIGPGDCFVPDLEPHEGWEAFVYPAACGTFYCPKCQAGDYRAHWKRLIDRIGPPPASVGRNPEGQDPQGLGAQHEHAVPSQTADAQPTGIPHE